MGDLGTSRLALTALVVVSIAGAASGQTGAELPSPLRFEDVPALAGERRAEVIAARERALAAEQRPVIVAALEDPMVSPSVDHWPFGMPAADVSLTVEQRFPLSGLRGNRWRVAEADAKRLRSDAQRTKLDVQLDAVSAFLMLYERRGMLRILEEQRSLARQFVGATNARYGSASGPQADVLRAEIEVARIDAGLKTIAAQIKASEAMLNASLGRATGVPIPELTFASARIAPPERAAAVSAALDGRPELSSGKSELTRAEAEIDVMKSMYFPMAMVRAGPAYTMSDGFGAMLMVGVSVPLWRDKLSAGVSEAEAMARMAKADLEAMRRMTEGQAASAREDVVAAHVQFVTLRDDVLPRARQAIEPSLSGYASGQLPLVSVLDAARTLWSTQAEVLGAEVSLGAAWARLGRATGDLEGMFHGTR
jgi:outer membrane protein TolC